MVWLGLSRSPVGMLMACALSGAGTGLMTPSVNAAVADVLAASGGDTRSGAALAGFQMVGDVGAILGPVLAGLAVDFGGYPAGRIDRVLATNPCRELPLNDPARSRTRRELVTARRVTSRRSR